MSNTSQKNIILASKSKARKHILESTGLQFSTKPAKIDEESIKAALIVKNENITPSDLAELLGQTKAINVSNAYPGSVIIGADQTMSCDGVIFNKAISLEEAKENFYFLRGKTHVLHASVCVAKEGKVLWSYCDEAHLTMINFSNEFLGSFLGQMGNEVLQTVGGYQLENRGSLLFEKIIGDYHTILGLPLLPLLKFLRSENLVMK